MKKTCKNLGLFKKFAALLLAALMMFAAAACGEKADETSGSGGNEAESKSKKTVKLSAQSSSEDVLAYLQGAFDETGAAFKNRIKVFPDASDIEAPAQADIKLSVNSLGDMFYPYGDYLAGSSLNLSAAIDPNGKAAQIAGSLNTPMGSFSDYALYLSSSLIALKAPDFTSASWLTINPATFIDDWNNSELGRTSPIDKSDVMAALGGKTITEIIDSLFDASTYIGDAQSFSDSSEFVKKIEDLSKDIENSTSYSYDDGIVSQTVPASAMNKFMASYFKEVMPGLIDSFIGEAFASYGVSASEISDMYEQMGDAVNFKKDLTVVYTISDGAVVGISAKNIAVAVADDYGGETVVDVNFSLDFTGSSNISDSWKADVSAAADGEEVSITLKRDAKDSGGSKSDVYALTCKASGETLFKATYSATIEGDGAFSLSLGASGGGADVSADLTGSMVKSPGKLALTNGRLTVSAMGTSIADLGVDFTVSGISGIPKPDSSGSKSIFDWEMFGALGY